MFKNRHIKVSLGKDDRQPVAQDPKTTVKEWTEAISDQANKAGLKVMGGVLVYIAADTVRKVLIAKATK